MYPGLVWIINLKFSLFKVLTTTVRLILYSKQIITVTFLTDDHFCIITNIQEYCTKANFSCWCGLVKLFKVPTILYHKYKWILKLNTVIEPTFILSHMHSSTPRQCISEFWGCWQRYNGKGQPWGKVTLRGCWQTLLAARRRSFWERKINVIILTSLQELLRNSLVIMMVPELVNWAKSVDMPRVDFHSWPDKFLGYNTVASSATNY